MSPAPPQEVFESYTEGGHSGETFFGAGKELTPYGYSTHWSCFVSIAPTHIQAFMQQPLYLQTGFRHSLVHKSSLKSGEFFILANGEGNWDTLGCQGSLLHREGFAILGCV